MELKKATLKEAADLVGHALATHQKGINEGWLRGGKDFKVSLSIGFEPGAGEGDFAVDVSISYTKDKVKDSFTRTISGQASLFDPALEGTGKKVKCPLRITDVNHVPRAGSPYPVEEVFASYCNGKCEHRSELHISQPNEKGEVLEQYSSCAAWADHDCHEAVSKMLAAETARQKELEEKNKKSGSGVNCTGCDHHRGMGNKKHGVKIPGNSGKCIRPEGPCEKATKADASTQKDPAEQVKNACGMKVSESGICAHLWSDPKEGDFTSACVTQSGGEVVDIACCRDCDQGTCNVRCELSVKKEKKEKKAKAA